MGLIWTLQWGKFKSTIKIFRFRQASMPMGILRQCIILEIEPSEVGKFTTFSDFLKNWKFLFFNLKTAFLILNCDNNSGTSSEGLHTWFSNQLEPVGFESMQSEVKKAIFWCFCLICEFCQNLRNCKNFIQINTKYTVYMPVTMYYTQNKTIHCI